MRNDASEMIRLFDSAGDYDLRGSEEEDCFVTIHKQACHILKWIDPIPNRRILELACGNGAVARSIRNIRPDLKYSCMDICPTLTEQAKALNPDINVYTGNCVNAIPGLKYDYVFSWGLVQYLSVDDFINMNRLILRQLNVIGEIWHFSTPDESKRFDHTMSVRKGLWSKAKGFLKYLIQSTNRKYSEASIWHSPDELKVDNGDDINIQTIQPGDVDYRFHIRITRKGELGVGR